MPARYFAYTLGKTVRVYTVTCRVPFPPTPGRTCVVTGGWARARGSCGDEVLCARTWGGEGASASNAVGDGGQRLEGAVGACAGMTGGSAPSAARWERDEEFLRSGEMLTASTKAHGRKQTHTRARMHAILCAKWHARKHARKRSRAQRNTHKSTHTHARTLAPNSHTSPAPTSPHAGVPASSLKTCCRWAAAKRRGGDKRIKCANIVRTGDNRPQ
jgi:hypothetical protein